ncbi:hypothetical protein [Ramlibacter sp. AN1133]|uniref:hypothetical protein n=1 Tax=Ramlibacter sp. AN1133 TaxID=3133429 RepID=UPI0030BFACEC
MSLFSWFSPVRKSRHEARASMLPDSGFSRMDSTKPVNGVHHNHPAPQPAPGHGTRKQERLVHREQLYAVVREAMVRAGVLSSSYKFKVLSLDTHGKQFMVMVDLAQGAVNHTPRMAEIEAMIAQSARAKHDILVPAVYWRASEHVAVGDPQQRMPAVSQPAALMPEPPQRRVPSRPAPLEPVSRPTPLERAARAAPLAAASRPAPVSQPAPLAAVPQPAPALATASQPAPLEPLQADEVAAFRKALDAGLRGEKALAAVNAGRTQNYTLLTGFEDTEMAPEATDQELSGTQYGALR